VKERKIGDLGDVRCIKVLVEAAKKRLMSIVTLNFLMDMSYERDHIFRACHSISKIIEALRKMRM